MDVHFLDFLEEKDTVPHEIKSSHHAGCLYLNCCAPYMCHILKCPAKLSLTLHYCCQMPDKMSQVSKLG